MILITYVVWLIEIQRKMVKAFPKQFTFWVDEASEQQKLKYIPSSLYVLKVFQRHVNLKPHESVVMSRTISLDESKSKNAQLNIKKLNLPQPVNNINLS